MIVPTKSDVKARLPRDWSLTLMPTFKGMKVFVLPGAFYGSCVAFFAEAGFESADCVEDADIVAFIGGVDVDPQLYGEAKIHQTQHPSHSRDTLEISVYEKCKELGKPMFGICRGAQFLHVMNGGTLWQHVEGHAGGSHLIHDTEENTYVMATSYHHQMLVPNHTIDVFAVTAEQISKEFHSADMVLRLNREGANKETEVEIEGGIYWNTKCFFVQGHPEVGSKEYRSWTMSKFSDFYDFIKEFEELDEDSEDEEEEQVA